MTVERRKAPDSPEEAYYYHHVGPLNREEN